MRPQKSGRPGNSHPSGRQCRQRGYLLVKQLAQVRARHVSAVIVFDKLVLEGCEAVDHGAVRWVLVALGAQEGQSHCAPGARGVQHGDVVACFDKQALKLVLKHLVHPALVVDDLVDPLAGPVRPHPCHNTITGLAVRVRILANPAPVVPVAAQHIGETLAAVSPTLDPLSERGSRRGILRLGALRVCVCIRGGQRRRGTAGGLGAAGLRSLIHRVEH
mmetsp:Transcript_25682/g.64745  ORF Transcript_25682/g.64745 Transcript_25682/m.64745 type:complete len:218 (+) Transcript_25682:411-1064(+)